MRTPLLLQALATLSLSQPDKWPKLPINPFEFGPGSQWLFNYWYEVSDSTQKGWPQYNVCSGLGCSNEPLKYMRFSDRSLAFCGSFSLCLFPLESLCLKPKDLFHLISRTWSSAIELHFFSLTIYVWCKNKKLGKTRRCCHLLQKGICRSFLSPIQLFHTFKTWCFCADSWVWLCGNILKCSHISPQGTWAAFGQQRF